MGWKLLNSRVVYKNSWINVKEDNIIFPNGKKGIYGVVSMANTVAILAKEKYNIFLVKQYRHTIKRNSWELPSGHIEKHEIPLNAAKRELREEAGLIAKKWTSLGYVCPALGIMNSKRYLFLAEGLSKVATTHEHSESEMVVKKIPLQIIESMVKNNAIFDDYTIVALCKLKLSRKG